MIIIAYHYQIVYLYFSLLYCLLFTLILITNYCSCYFYLRVYYLFRCLRSVLFAIIIYLYNILSIVIIIIIIFTIVLLFKRLYYLFLSRISHVSNSLLVLFVLF